jgi:putative transposase
LWRFPAQTITWRSGMGYETESNMPRRRLAGSGGFVFHVMNRSAKQLTLFDEPAEYEMFLQVLSEAETACPIRLLEYCVMPNHWHLLVWPERDDQLTRFMRWITGVHAQRWRQARGQPAKGAVYQGR